MINTNTNLFDLNAVAERFSEHPDFRLLRRVPDLSSISFAPGKASYHRIAILDCETTGLDPERDKVIELSISTMILSGDRNRPCTDFGQGPAESARLSLEPGTSALVDRGLVRGR